MVMITYDLENSNIKVMAKVNPPPIANLRPRVQIDMFAFRFVAIAPFFAEIYSIRYLTLKIQSQGHGQG